MSALWVSDHSVRHWHLHKPCEEFEKKYDQVQSQILDISCMDDLLSGNFHHPSHISTHNYSVYILPTGMLSKSRGQILRVGAVMHALFHLDTPLSIPDHISTAAIKAAKNFVELCNQHAAFLAGRGVISDSIESLVQLQKG